MVLTVPVRAPVGGTAWPPVLRKYREPKWYMERGAQSDAKGYSGPYRGLGIPHRPARGRAAAAAPGAGAHARRVHRPRRCGLCYHERVFDTCTGLNNHSSQQHGFYYSLKGDCFVPLGEGGIRRDAPALAATGYRGLGAGFDPRLRGRGRHVPGRIRPRMAEASLRSVSRGESAAPSGHRKSCNRVS